MALLDGGYLVGGGKEMLKEVHTMLEREGVLIRANPDVYTHEYVQFGIEDARALIARASSRAIGESSRVFIIVTTSINAEAQNALLKTFEDSPAHATFFLIVPSPHTLLATLRSRMQVLSFSGATDTKDLIDARTFVKAKLEKRIEMLKILLDKGEDEGRDLSAITKFLESLERIEAERIPKRPEGLHAIYRARSYMMDKGALMKPLLEQVALLVP